MFSQRNNPYCEFHQILWYKDRYFFLNHQTKFDKKSNKNNNLLKINNIKI